MKRLAFILLLLSTSVANCASIIVSKDGKVTSLKLAVESARSLDTIIIKPGVYREGNIIIEKSLVIIGEDYPVLDGESKYEILTIHASHVTVKGLRFIRTGVSSIQDLAGVKLLDAKYVNILDNKFEDTFFAIHGSNSSYCRVENNELKAHVVAEYQIGNGIHMWKCNHLTIADNRVQGHRDGIYFEFVTNSIIHNNHSEQNLRYGLHFMFSHNNEYRENAFVNNGAGVAVMYTAGVKMIGNTFDHNWGSSAYGLLLKDIRDSEVRHNHFIGNSVGIFMEGSSRIQFTDNEFKQNGYAIRLQASCDDNTITRNNFSGNTFDIATNGTLVLNKVESNYWDKYEGYDMNKDRVGDIPYHPVSMYSMVVEQMPAAVLLWRSFLVLLLDKAERAIPALTPENLKDDTPLMKPYDLHQRS
ncbi:MAG: nitrous oxide reductase family maturation protein NosD [Chryseolinea sp.]